MALLDRIKDGITKVVPASEPKRNKIPPPSTLGIANAGAGHAPFEDDMIISKPMIVFHTSQIFFNFLAMCCFASVAAFQAKWHIGPSGLSGLAVFLSVMGMFLPAFMLLVPVAYEKYDKLIRLARALREVRVGFILTGTGTAFSLLIAFATTISAFTEAGCKDASKDPHAKALGDSFKNALPGWCSTKKAGAIFFWGAFIFWAASLVLLILDWRSGKLHAGPRDPPFTHPTQEATEFEMDYDPDDEEYQHIPPARRGGGGSDSPTAYDPAATGGANPFADSNRYAGAQPRPSVDAYGAFSDPAPSGFSPAAPRFDSGGSGTPPALPQPDLGPPLGVSRTMQYADPYAAVRATVAGGQQQHQATEPQGYEGYQGYR